MSRQTSNSPPQPDIYVGLLFVAVASLITGCIFLALELNEYNWTFN
jgi:hypothetical protein